MDLNLSVLQEPRGVMRIFHFIFAIVSFATTVDYGGILTLECYTEKFNYDINYPFDIFFHEQVANCTGEIMGSFASDAKFYVCTGVLSMLYAVGILIVYMKFDQLYKSNENIPLGDFILSVILAIFWLSSSAAWANGLTGLKNLFHNIKWEPEICNCHVTTPSYSSLNISLIVGFLNFFLWAANLWFLYKETKWFQKPPVNVEA